ncbi:MAG: DUF881 domain-containing protein [Clostridia bacterium]|nr:DUF881 domain-containing protein [Clostridia bacterium]
MNNKWKIQLSVGLICMILGFAITIQFRSVQKNNGAGTISGLRAAEIQSMYQKEKEKNEALYIDYERIKNDLDQYKDAINDTNATTKLMKEQLDNAEILAGMKEVEGPGVVVKMSDGTKTPLPGESESLYWLHDSDLLLVINELKDAGAEAISVNGERLISTSEVRCVGSVLSVNNVRTGAPFIINAIGDPKTLESALLFKGGVVADIASYCEVDVKTADKVTVPAYKGAVNFKYATPTTVKK